MIALLLLAGGLVAPTQMLFHGLEGHELLLLNAESEPLDFRLEAEGFSIEPESGTLAGQGMARVMVFPVDGQRRNGTILVQFGDESFAPGIEVQADVLPAPPAITGSAIGAIAWRSAPWGIGALAAAVLLVALLRRPHA